MLGVAGNVRAGRGGLQAVLTLGLVLLVACYAILPACADADADTGTKAVPNIPKRANFLYENPSSEARDIADWVVDSGDNRGLSFGIVDKRQARVFVFDARGKLTGAAAALLGLTVGDDSVPGIGERPMARIRPEERTTPAGRFVAVLGYNTHGKEILWIDYDNAVSMHAVIAGTVSDRRTQRLASPSVLDNRISFGCINVPTTFFEQVVLAAFSAGGIVYVLPETRSARQVFGSYKVDEHALAQNAHPTAHKASSSVVLGDPEPSPAR